jgi:tryptophan synthase alpha chain
MSLHARRQEQSSEVTQVPSTEVRAGSRLQELFAGLRRRGELGLMPFLTCGYPDLASTLELVPALEAAGADALELGVPFSDPVADGATIQRASEGALRNGVTLAVCLDVLQQLRRKHDVRMPILLMGYYNVFFTYGIERIAAELAAAGGDGLIVPDLPPEEATPLQEALRAHGLDLIFFVAPTSSDGRIRQIAARASGFLYCVSLTGVTGARERLADELPAFLQRVRAATDLPLVVGFGISRPEHIARLRGLADAAIVASALIDLLDRTPPAERVAAAQAYLRSMKAAAR